jgi:hypothetical protein
MLIQEKACPKSKNLAIKHAVASLMRNVVFIFFVVQIWVRPRIQPEIKTGIYLCKLQ